MLKTRIKSIYDLFVIRRRRSVLLYPGGIIAIVTIAAWMCGRPSCGARQDQEDLASGVDASRHLARLPRLDRVPDALRCERHVEMRHSIIAQRVHHSIHHGGEAAGTAGFATAFAAERISLGRRRAFYGDR